MGQTKTHIGDAGGDEPWMGPARGTLIDGKYEVDELLGDGGMGVVVSAHHRDLGHRVALKFLREAGHPEAVGRFVREGQAACAIRSEYVARVIDIGALDDGRPYMVMEHLVGCDLQQVLSERALSVDEALAFILQACEAIAAAHSVGVVHRDLKPSNLFVTQRADGSPLLKVLDFGIAKALDVATSGVSLTRTGTALGSPIYMSPEQVRNAKSSDRRTDVWGIGAVLYELLSNQPPFDADTVPAICAKIVADEPEPLCAQRPDISPDLEAVVARCMRKCPDDRYPDIGALADALLPFASPDRAAQVERIRRIVDGASSLPSASASWNGRDSLADTVSSTRGAALGTLSSDAVAVTIDERAPATSWQRRAIVPAMLMLLALVVVALRSDDDARHAQPWPAARIAIAASTAVSEAKSIVADAPTADDEAKPMIAPAPAIAARRARRTVASTARPRPSSIAAEPPHENDDVLSARK